MKSHLLTNGLFKGISRGIGKIVLFCLGWKLVGQAPKIKKMVIIGAPHTSNWDFVLFLCLIFNFQLPARWMAKASMFKNPFKPLLLRLGGIPVDRSKRHNLVHHSAEAIRNADEMILTIAPSGTRSRVKKWKTGFYHIAHQAQVPIVCGFVDYEKKIVGIGPSFHTTGNIEKDMAQIQAFYADKKGKA
ncbi:MAG: lysophospholipid acyltransferase family protein, partial [Desulfovibrionales bacterium]|nr:lysophospholipid acyltransferase family protein [Desulfovibrionales bacterium]